MPRKGIISTDKDTAPETDIPVYYCVCGHLALISEEPLEMMPKRRTDGAAFFDSSKTKHSITWAKDDTLILRRDNGIEIQHCWKCNSCGLPVAYQINPKSKQYFLRPDALLKPGETSEVDNNLPDLEELEALQKSTLQKKKQQQQKPGEPTKEAKPQSLATVLAAHYMSGGGSASKSRQDESAAEAQ